LPGQPKRYATAYFIWMNENREAIKGKFPGLSVTDFGKKCGELWKELTDKKVWPFLFAQRVNENNESNFVMKEWEVKAVEDKKRYEREMEEWKANGGLQAMENAKKEARKAKNAQSAPTSSAKSKSKPK